jgi:hypothetical protein
MQHLSIITRHARIVVATTIVGAGALSGCSADSLGIGANSQSQLSFSATGASTASANAAALVPVTVGTHTLDLTQVSLTVDRAELKRAHTDACAGDDDNHPTTSTTAAAGSCAEVKIGPTTVDLPLSGSLVSLPANALPSGTFREFTLRVSQVRLKGTYDTQAFDVTLTVNVRQEVEFATPLVVTDGSPTSITVSVPAGDWLKNPDGTLIDPGKIASTPSLLSAVQARIAASFRAFEDRDHDGKDDHGSHGEHS